MSRGQTWALVLGLTSLVGCSSSEPAPPPEPDPFAPPAEDAGFQLKMEVEAPAASEIWKCKIDYLPPTLGFFAANRVASRQSDFIHHMDVMALAFTPLELEPGIYDCDAIYYANSALMESGIFLYASQVPEQQIELPPGTAAMIPSKMKYMQEVHYVNTSSAPVNVFSHVNVHTIPPLEVTDRIWGGVVRDAHIAVPPLSKHVEWTRCIMNQDVEVLFLSSHTHRLGKKVTVARYDGKATGPVFYENDDWHAPKLEHFAPPMSLKKGDGLEFHCHFENDGAETVNWGFAADDEMCQLGLVFTPSSTTAACEVVETSDGVIDTSGTGK
ncbi:MAG: hypothetical protein FJ095_11470 [Deltaproteobacteria bacterium]|nr:hypothetical protein [Deltaproteobacteria bacterium]